MVSMLDKQLSFEERKYIIDKILEISKMMVKKTPKIQSLFQH